MNMMAISAQQSATDIDNKGLPLFSFNAGLTDRFKGDMKAQDQESIKDSKKEYDEKSVIKLMDKGPLKIMDQIIKLLDSDIEIRDMKQSLFEGGKNEKIPFGLIMQTLRLAIIGQLSGPDLFQICALIGKDVSLKRVQKFKSFCLK